MRPSIMFTPSVLITASRRNGAAAEAETRNSPKALSTVLAATMEATLTPNLIPTCYCSMQPTMRPKELDVRLVTVALLLQSKAAELLQVRALMTWLTTRVRIIWNSFTGPVEIAWRRVTLRESYRWRCWMAKGALSVEAGFSELGEHSR